MVHPSAPPDNSHTEKGSNLLRPRIILDTMTGTTWRRRVAAALLLGLVAGFGVVLGCQAANLVEDTAPSFAAGAEITAQNYRSDAPIPALALPAANGGDGALTYSLTPDVPGLFFDPASRTLTGTPSEAGSYSMTYQAADADGDAVTLRFTIAVAASEDGEWQSTATAIETGSPLAGTIDTPGDVDYFKVTVNEHGTLIAATDTGIPSHTGTAVRIVGVAGYSSTNNDFEDSVPVGPGTYYVRVTAVPDVGTGAYSLAVWLLGAGNGSFDIDLRYQGTPPTTAQQVEFEAAARFWTRAITGDLPDIPVLSSGWRCSEGDPSIFGGTFEDVIIYVRLAALDGAEGTLAQAGPCWIRAIELSGLPTLGEMVFDVADLASLEAGGNLRSIVIHEIAHVLGFGTLWREFEFLQEPSIVRGVVRPGRDTHYSGPRARREFDRIGGTGYPGAKVPVENDTNRYGEGSLDSHWRESVFGPELMTSTLNRDRAIPVSRMTVAALADIGYEVDYTVVDAFTLPAFGPAPARSDTGRTIDLHGDVRKVAAKVAHVPDDVVRYISR